MSLVFESMYWEKAYSEKRDYVRMKVPTTITINTIPAKINFNGMTKNFSSQGVLFTSPRSLSVGQKINATLNPGDAEYELVNTAEILRCIPDEQGNQNFLIAAKFV